MTDTGTEIRVGVFDSGIGGLTILDACVRLNPDCTFFYLGDNGRAPYGSRRPEEIVSFVREALDRFAKLKVDAVVLACNTATAVCADVLRTEYSFPIVGVEPAVKPASDWCERILVLATPRTAEGERLQLLLKRFPERQFTVYAAEGLAAAVEDRFLRGKPLELSEHLPQGDFDGVVLGCTHYSFLRREISAFYDAPVFDSALGTAKRLNFILKEESQRRGEQEKPKKIGILNHSQPKPNPNNCFSQNQKKKGDFRVFFLGEYEKPNKYLYECHFS